MDAIAAYPCNMASTKLLTVRLTEQELRDFNVVAGVKKQPMSELVRVFVTNQIESLRRNQPQMFEPQITELLEIWGDLGGNSRKELIERAASMIDSRGTKESKGKVALALRGNEVDRNAPTRKETTHRVSESPSAGANSSRGKRRIPPNRKVS